MNNVRSQKNILPANATSALLMMCGTFQITADPYFHVRNASEHGALSVLKVMFKYRDDLRVQGVGLQRIAGSLLEGELVRKILTRIAVARQHQLVCCGNTERRRFTC